MANQFFSAELLSSVATELLTRRDIPSIVDVLLPTKRDILKEETIEFHRGRHFIQQNDPNAEMFRRDLEQVFPEELMVLGVDYAEGFAPTEELPPHPLVKANAIVAANIDTMFYWK